MTTKTEVPKLTKEQVAEIRGLYKEGDQAAPCRFTLNGCGYDPFNGTLCSRGCNVLYQPVFWQITEEQGKRIAELTGANRVVVK